MFAGKVYVGNHRWLVMMAPILRRDGKACRLSRKVLVVTRGAGEVVLRWQWVTIPQVRNPIADPIVSNSTRIFSGVWKLWLPRSIGWIQWTFEESR